MKTTQKGSMVYLVVAIIAVVAAIGAYTYYSNNKTTDTSTTASSTVETETSSTTTSSNSPSISWSYVKNGNSSDVILWINKKEYKTGVSAAGCGTEVAKANLAAGQLSATQCAIKGSSGTEVAVYREGKGYKVTSTEIYQVDDGQTPYYKRGVSTTVLNIK